LALVALGAATAFADADEAWRGIVKLEEPPARKFSSRDEARRVVLERLGEQEAALRDFSRKYPLDDRVTDADLRLARVLAVQSDLLPDPAKFADSLAVLDALDRKPGQTRERLADIAFARLALRMARIQTRDESSREWLTRSLRDVQGKYPGDRRIPQLIAEVATFHDADPKVKSELLHEAQALAKDESLKLRISDDLRRLDLLGRKVPMEFVSVDGKEVALSDYRGAVVVVYFFADWSPPSVAGLGELQAVLRKYPDSKLRAIGISLDAAPETAKGVLERANVDMPVKCDGRSWESPMLRKYGINVLPTVWVFDRKGHLRSLNARDSIDTTVRELIRER
jgi:peroxiredoxin